MNKIIAIPPESQGFIHPIFENCLSPFNPNSKITYKKNKTLVNKMAEILIEARDVGRIGYEHFSECAFENLNFMIRKFEAENSYLEDLL